MIKMWVIDALYVVAHYRNLIQSLQSQITRLEKIIKYRNDLHVDYYARDCSKIIAIGHYKNRDYIQTFSVDRDDFHGLIERLRELERCGHVHRVDAIPSIKAVIMDNLE